MSTARPDISIVVPCFNEQDSLPLFIDELMRVARDMSTSSPLTFEVVLVDDGSSDDTLSTIKALAREGREPLVIKWISFSRNFGKEAALYAGLSHATGDLVATMDAGMQDPPVAVAGDVSHPAGGGLRQCGDAPHHPKGRAAHPLLVRAHVLPHHQ